MPWYIAILLFGGLVLLVSCSSVLLARAFLLVIIVRGGSMSPALEDGDRVLAWRPSRSRRVFIGDIVMFRESDLVEETKAPSLSFHIKRVVALAGEHYSSSTPPIGYSEHVTLKDHKYIWQIPPDHIFVCGDNCEQSIDSRSWGPLPLRNVRGIVVKRLAPSPTSLSAHVDIVTS